jgi:hypothetical protein
LQSSGRARYRAAPSVASVHATRYTVARQSNLQQASAVSQRTDLTMTQARDLVRARVVAARMDEGVYQVVESQEAVAV